MWKAIKRRAEALCRGRGPLRHHLPVFNVGGTSNGSSSRRPPRDAAAKECCQGVSRQCLFACFLSCCIGSYFYVGSLRGGDLNYVKDHLSVLALYLVVSVVFFTFPIATILTSHVLSRSAKTLTLSLVFLNIIFLFVYDNDTCFENHGQYNAVVFTAVTLPVNAIIYCAVVLYRLFPRQCPSFSVYSLVFLIVAVTFQLVFYQNLYLQGLNGKQALIRLGTGETLCPLHPGIPWQDLFPKGIMNFWTGSQSCPANKYSLRVEFSEDGSMKVDGCPRQESLTYVPFPNTRSWNTSSKVMYTFNKVVLEQLKELPYAPWAKLPEDCEAVVFQCGSASRQMFFRTTPQKEPSSSPPSSPPSLSAANAYNVIILFIDAVSHRHFFRKLPLTASALSRLNRPGLTSVYEYFRYSLAGFNTDPNTLVLYTGHLWDDNPESARVHQFPPVWEEFRRHKYVTSWMSDDCDDWSVTYMKNSSSVSVSHELLAPFCHPEYFPSAGHPFGNFQGPYSIRRRCLFGHHVHYHAFSWIRHLVSLYHKRQPFALFNAFIEGHEGSGEVISTMDEDLAHFLDSSAKSGLLDDTLLLVLSDHGNHMSLPYLYTDNGYQEHASPFLFVVAPDSLTSAVDVDDPSRTVGENLRRNEQMLVNPFDVHYLLKVVMRWNEREKKTEENQKLWQQSLFSRKNYNRTCEEAKVPKKYCRCHPETGK